MNISVFGLGYVGTVLAACFARDGHTVIGVDIDDGKVALINSGKSPIIEMDVEPMIAEGVRAGRIRATTDPREAVLATELSMLCVGTPSAERGDLDLTHVRRVCESIGAALRDKAGRHLVVIRSTMLPGSIRGTVIPALESASGRKAGADFGVAINPEFLRESSAVHDFHHPPKTVIGADRDEDAERIASLYRTLTAPLILTRIEVAEMVKYVDNVFHALKITFANEIGSLCGRLGVEADEVMRIFCLDTKLNLSPAYLTPGFAFGGSCLPKDLRALTRLAQTRDVAVPVLNAIGASNEEHIRGALARIRRSGKRRIGVLGFAFKGGTDDLRESPIVTLAEMLLGKGYELKLYDDCVSLAQLVGANRRYMERHLPHLSRLMVESVRELAAHAELLVIGNNSEKIDETLSLLGPDQAILDLTPGFKTPTTAAHYEHICGGCP